METRKWRVRNDSTGFRALWQATLRRLTRVNAVDSSAH